MQLKLKNIQPEDDIERIVLFMKRSNLNIKQFAAAIGITPNYLTNVLNRSYPLTNRLKGKINTFILESKSA